jgi:hypothetical protein
MLAGGYYTVGFLTNERPDIPSRTNWNSMDRYLSLLLDRAGLFLMILLRAFRMLVMMSRVNGDASDVKSEAEALGERSPCLPRMVRWKGVNGANGGSCGLEETYGDNQ